MLLITVELASARTGKRTVLGRAELYNDATGTTSRGNYVVRILRKGENFGGRVWKTGEVKAFPRNRLGPWDLMLRALLNAVGVRNP